MPQSLPLLTQDASKSWDGNLVQLKHRFRQAVSHDSSHAVLKTCVGCQIEYLEVCHWLEGARESADVFKLSQIGLTSQKLSLACFVYSGGASIEVWRACLLNLDPSNTRQITFRPGLPCHLVIYWYRGFCHFHRNKPPQVALSSMFSLEEGCWLLSRN